MSAALPAGLTPAQRDVCRDLLAWGGDRPAGNPDIARDLERRLAAVLDDVMGPDDDRVWISKSALRALDCDGRWLDRQDQPFEVSTPLVRGSIVHAAIELDTAQRRQRDPVEVVDHVVATTIAAGQDHGQHLCDMAGFERAKLQAAAVDRVVQWRELWPLVDGLVTRFEQPLRWHFDRGRATIQGRPDLIVTSPTPRPHLATAVIVDLKSGWRNEVAERQDLRLYGLLWALTRRELPFRWATYYLAEGRWDIEHANEQLLDSTIRRIGHGVARMLRLRQPVPEEDLALRPGAHCRFCTREPNCPAVTQMR